MTSSRRRLLGRVGRAVGAGAILGTAGCTSRDGPVTDGSPPVGTDGDGDGSPTATAGGSEPTATPVETVTAPLDGSWTSYRQDAANTATTDDPGPTEEPAVVWRRPTATDARPATDPVPADGAFVFVASSGRPYALGADDGRIRWRGDRTVDAGVDPVVADGTVGVADGDTVVGFSTDAGDERWSVTLGAVVVGLAAGHGIVVAATDEGVTALSPGDGAERWHHGVDGTVATRPVAGDGTVAVGLGSGVVALDAETGERRWQNPAGNGEFPPAVGSGHVYVSTEDRLRAFEKTSGAESWMINPDLPVVASPVVDAGTVFLGAMTDDAERDRSGSGTDTATPPPTDVNRFAADLYALEPGDGTERWRSGVSGRWNFTSGPPGLSLAATADRAFVLVSDGLLAFDAATGEGTWSVQARGTGPAVSDGVVSTGVLGVAAEDGSELWRFDVGDRVDSSPAVVGNTAYVGSDDTHLYAVEANSGAVEWRAQTGGQVKSSPAVGDEAVYVGSGDGHLYAFDRSDGSERWRFDTGGPVRSSPTLRDGSAYVGSESGILFAVDAAAGTERWRVDYGDRFISATPAVVDGRVYAGANDVFRALSVDDGTELWGVDVGPTRVLQSVPAVADGRVFVNPGETLYSFDATDGTELWSRPTRGTVVNAPAVRDGTVYSPGGEYVYAFDAETGDRRWRTSVGSAGWVVATDRAVIAASADDSILALDPGDGSERWRLAGVDSTRSPGVAGEYLFVGDFDGRINAIGPEPE